MVLCAILTLVGWWSIPATAHELQTSRGITVVMHIEPNDTPRAQQSSELDLFLDNTDGSFDLGNYRAELTITNQHTSSHEQVPLTHITRRSATAPFRFRSGGTYTIRLQGTPKTASEQAFVVTFRVSVTDAGLSRSAAFRIQSLLAIVAIVGLLIWIRSIWRRPTKVQQ